MKYYRFLFGFMIVLGIIFITIVYAQVIGLLNLSVLPGSFETPELTQFIANVLVGFSWFCLLIGPLFLTVGIWGFGKQYFKQHQNLFTTLTIILIPSITYILFLYFWVSSLKIGY